MFLPRNLCLCQTSGIYYDRLPLYPCSVDESVFPFFQMESLSKVFRFEGIVAHHYIRVFPFHPFQVMSVRNSRYLCDPSREVRHKSVGDEEMR